MGEKDRFPRLSIYDLLEVKQVNEETKELKQPLYVAVHERVAQLGTATATDLASSLGLDRSQVTGALVTLQKIGAAERVTRGVWKALGMPDGYPLRRGRKASDESVRGRVLSHLGLGPSALADIVDALAPGSEDVKKSRARVAHALVGLKKEGLVVAEGSRGTYRYALAASLRKAS